MPVIGNSTAKDSALVELSIEGSSRAIIVGMAGMLTGLLAVGTASDVLNFYAGTTSLPTPMSVLALPVPVGRVPVKWCGRNGTGSCLTDGRWSCWGSLSSLSCA